MANHFYSINRGRDGLVPSDITKATSSTTTDDVELRVADGASLNRLDVLRALDAFELLFQSGGNAPGGTLLPGT